MILTALDALQSREKVVADLDFEMKPISYLIPIDREGVPRPYRSTFDLPSDPNSQKRKPRPVIPTYPMPRELPRTSGARAFFFFDKAEYVLGIDPDGRRSSEKLQERATLFRERVRQCAEETADVGAKAVLFFLKGLASGRFEPDLQHEYASNALFTFELVEESGLIVERPRIRKYWKALRAISGGPAVRCLVTGDLGPAAVLHPQVKIPGGSTSGVPLVSFNSSAFESYGWSGGENAPISQRAADSYGAALSFLLAPTPIDSEGEIHPSRNLRLSSDTTVCFWSRCHGAAALVGGAMEVDEQVVRQEYRAIWRGKGHGLIDDPSDFYALTLTGTQGRALPRGWFRTTVAEVVRSVARFFADLDLVRLTPPSKTTGYPPAHSLQKILRSLAPQGKMEQIPPNLAQAVFESGLSDGPLPLTLIQRALVRVRAEATRNDWADQDRRDARHALIKAVLERRRRHGQNKNDYPELQPMLDPDNKAPGYLLGRLMAVIQRLQQTALGDINASVVDRYFGAAMATPRVVFIRLLRNSRHHARKAKDSEKTRGYAFYLESLLDELILGFDPANNGFPPYLDLEQQGLFVVGYHQQRHSFFQKKTTSQTENSLNDPAANSVA